MSLFSSGFLVDQNFTPEQRDDILKYVSFRKSEHFAGETILYDRNPSGNIDFPFNDSGSFVITLSGPGFNNTNNRSKFIGNWVKEAIFDNLTINDDFTWSRTKRIDANPDFLLKWKGTYSFENDLLVFSLTEQGFTSTEFSGLNERHIPNFGIMYGPIANTRIIDEPLESRIRGLVSNNVSGIIHGTGSGIASGYISGSTEIIVEGEVSGIISNDVDANLNGIGYGVGSGIISDDVTNTLSGLGYGNTNYIILSGTLDSTLYHLINIMLTPDGTIDREATISIPMTGPYSNVPAETSGFIPTISGTVNGYIRDIPIIGNLVGTLLVPIGGLASGEVNATASITVTGIINNVAVEGIDSNIVDGIPISGLIQETVNNVTISGIAVGLANGVNLSGIVNGIIDNGVVRGTISANGYKEISGLINGEAYADLAGLVHGICPVYPASVFTSGEIQETVLEGLISGIIISTRNIPVWDIYNDTNFTEVVTQDTVDRFRNELIPVVLANITENEIQHFGIPEEELIEIIENSLLDIINRELLISFCNDLTSFNLTPRLTIERIITTIRSNVGNFMEGYFEAEGTAEVADISGALSGYTPTIDGIATIRGIIEGGDVVVSGTTGFVDDTSVTVQDHTHPNTGNLTTSENGSHGHTAQNAGSHSHTIQSGGDHTHSTTSDGGHTHTSDGEHTHTSDGGHSHIIDEDGTINSAGDHTHNSAGGHTHDAIDGHSHSIASSGGHTHSTDDEGSHTHIINNNGAHTHTLNVPTPSGGGHDDAFLNNDGVTVNPTTGEITGGLTTITGNEEHRSSINDAIFDTHIRGGYFESDIVLEGDIVIRGTNIVEFTNNLVAVLSRLRDEILLSLPVNRTVFDEDEFDVSGWISNEVLGVISGFATTEASGEVFGQVTGIASGMISGSVEDTVIFENISGFVSGIVSGPVSGIGYGRAEAILFAMGEGSVGAVDKVILNSFLDDSFTDTLHTYTLPDGGIVADMSGSVHNPGGRGELAKYFIYSENYNSNVLYDVGSWSDNTNTIARISGFPDMEAVSGIEYEFSGYSNFFGGRGGNASQNSLNLYEETMPEDGHIKIIAGSPVGHLISGDDGTSIIIPESFRALEITASGIEVLPDRPELGISGILINRMLADNETEVYYRILDREQELDLEESTLNEVPISDYNVKFEEPVLEYDEDSNLNESEQLRKKLYSDNELYIVKMDNHRRKMLFLTPFRSNNPEGNPRNIRLDLKTTNRRFYFAIARDNLIDTVTIGGRLFHPDDQDEDGILRKRRERDNNGNVILDQEGNPTFEDCGFNAGTSLEIEVRFREESAALLQGVLQYYLGEDLVGFVSKSNNFLQMINFTMPERDVLLFLRTETNFMLNISISENNRNLIRVEHETLNTFHSSRHIPIIIQHYRDNEIVIEIWFDDPFAEIDRENLKMQLSDVDDIRFNDAERIYTPFFGYDINMPQRITFLMPARDVILILRGIDYRFRVRLIRDRETTGFEDVTVCLCENSSQASDTCAVCDERFTLDMIDSDVIREDQWRFFLQREGDGIRITVIFKENVPFGLGRNIYQIDEDFLRAQFPGIGIEERVLVNADDISQGFVGNTQTIRFSMPLHNLDLVIRVKSLLRLLTIRPQAFQYIDNVQRQIRGVIHEGTRYEFGYGLLGALEGITLPIIRETQVIDLFVEFRDIYMHLDRDFLTSQEPRLTIQEAGEFLAMPPLPPQVSSAPEFFQHVRVVMTEGDLVLVMRWVERLYRINYVIQNAFFVSNEISDTNILGGRLGGTGEQVLLPQFIMPHYTYTRIWRNGSIVQNPVRITSQLLQSMILDIANSTYILTRGNGLGNPAPLNSLNNIIINAPPSNPNFDLTFPMPRHNITFNIHVKIAPGTIVLSHFIAAVNRTFLLMPGIYTMWLSGASGGHGAFPAYGMAPIGTGRQNREFGTPGAGRTFTVKVNRITTLHFNLGRRGEDAAQGSGRASGGGGGGGGTSLLEFSSSVDVQGINSSARRVFVTGGNGGRGSDYQWYISTPAAAISRWGVWVGMRENPTGPFRGGGAGGIGGGRPGNPDRDSGNGSRGGDPNSTGSSSMRGEPGRGGAGFSISSAINISNNPIDLSLITQNRWQVNGTPTGDGWLVIQYDEPLPS